MPEFQRQGPLDGLSLQQRAVTDLGEAGIGLGELRHLGAVNLRARRDDGPARDALAATLAMALPATTETLQDEERTLLGLGPDEWLLVGPDGPATAAELASKLSEQFVGVTDVSDNFVTLFLRGHRVLDLLAKAVPIDLDPEVFGPGRCAQTLLAKAEVILHRGSGAESGTYRVLCRPSFAQYVFAWLEDAAQEYGLVILGE